MESSLRLSSRLLTGFNFALNNVVWIAIFWTITTIQCPMVACEQYAQLGWFGFMTVLTICGMILVNLAVKGIRRFYLVSFISLLILAVWIPAVVDYTGRDVVSKGISAARQTLSGLEEYYRARGEWPDGLEAVGGPPPVSGGCLKSVSFADAVLTLHYTMWMGECFLRQKHEYTMEFHPQVNDGQISWNCRRGTVPEKFRPIDCRNSGRGLSFGRATGLFPIRSPG